MGIYSKDLRVRAVAAVDRGVPRAEVLETFSMSLTTLKRWLRMSREGKALSPGVFPRDASGASSLRPKRTRPCGSNSKRTTTLPSSVTARCGKRSVERGYRWRR
jgi:transposase-like protein